MTSDELIERLRKAPFQPFEVHLNNGSSFRISHPDQAMVYPHGESLFAVVGKKVEQISLINIAHISSEALL